MLSPEPHVKKDAQRWTTVVPLTCHLIPPVHTSRALWAADSWLSSGLQHITESHYLPPKATEIMVLCPSLRPSSDLDSAGLRDLVALFWSPPYTSSWVHKYLIVCSGFLYLSTGSVLLPVRALWSLWPLLYLSKYLHICVYSLTHIFYNYTYMYTLSHTHIYSIAYIQCVKCYV